MLPEYPYFVILSLRLIVAKCAGTELINVNILTMGPNATNNVNFLPYIGPAIDTAVERIQYDLTGMANISHTYIYGKDCAYLEANGDYLFSNWFYRLTTQSHLLAVISPGCNEVPNINKLAASFNVLFITSSSVYTDQSVRNKTISPTWLTTATSSAPAYVKLYTEVLKKYNWTSVFIVIDPNALPNFLRMGKEVIAARATQIGAKTTVTHVTSRTPAGYADLLIRFKSVSRVLLYFGNAAEMRTLMVYIATEPYKNRAYGLLTWQNNDTEDELAKKAFASVLVLHNHEWHDLSIEAPVMELRKKWIRRTKCAFNISYELDDQPFPLLMASYAAVAVFGQVLRELLLNNTFLDLKNGAEIARLFWNRSFESDLYSIFIDETGQRGQDLAVAYFPLNGSGQRETFLVLDARSFQLIEPGQIQWLGGRRSLPLNEPLCGFTGERCFTSGQGTTVLLNAIIAVSGCLVLALLCTVYLWRRWYTDSAGADTWWKINSEHLKFETRVVVPGYATNLQLITTSYFTGYATLNGKEIWTTPFEITPTKHMTLLFDDDGFRPSKPLLMLLTQLRCTSHNNINKFIGITTLRQDQKHLIVIISDFEAKGNIRDFFESSGATMVDKHFVTSFILDLAEGIRFIHASPLGFHGELTTSVCLIDKHFSLKIGKLGYQMIKQHFSPGAAPLIDFIAASQPDTFSKAGDVYAFGIILFQILTETTLLPQDVLKMTFTEATADTGLDHDQFSACCSGFPLGFSELILHCWFFDPAKRPTIFTCKKDVQEIVQIWTGNREDIKLLDRVVMKLAKYAADLEDRVAEKTSELMNERAKCDMLLGEILPVQVAQRLREGLAVLPELFEDTTVLFSGVGGFLEYVDNNLPVQVTQILDDIETLLDDVITDFNAYKVEAVADGYMAASGVPIRNKDGHVREACRLAVKMQVEFTRLFGVRDLFLLIGINSGGCAAGVVGYKKPRYCLFGDTVNTASRMCTYGAPKKIHISQSSEALLRQQDKNSEFLITPRGVIHVKGKAAMYTYWLEYETQETYLRYIKYIEHCC